MVLDPHQHAVIYSMPGSREFHLVHQFDFGKSSEEPAGIDYFVYKAYQDGDPPNFIRAEVHRLIDPTSLSLSQLPEPREVFSPDRGSYELLVAEAASRCVNSGGKIVLSRSGIRSFRQFDAGAALVNLRMHYPDAFVYLLLSGDRGCWMGATPETLIALEDGVYSTMALAGTRWDDACFGQKEFDEQLLVTRDIMTKLQDEVIEVSDVYEHTFGNLRHLRTDMRWEAEKSVLHFAEVLHPTSAICGYPQKEAASFIAANEGRDRELYTGYIGMVKHNEMSCLFVNLRCLQLFRNRMVLYAGGGINALSDPSAEWEETERKMNAVLGVLKYD